MSKVAAEFSKFCIVNIYQITWKLHWISYYEKTCFLKCLNVESRKFCGVWIQKIAQKVDCSGESFKQREWSVSNSTSVVSKVKAEFSKFWIVNIHQITWKVHWISYYEKTCFLKCLNVESRKLCGVRIQKIAEKVDCSGESFKQGERSVSDSTSVMSKVKAEFSKFCGSVEILLISCCLVEMKEGIAISWNQDKTKQSYKIRSNLELTLPNL